LVTFLEVEFAGWGVVAHCWQQWLFGVLQVWKKYTKRPLLSAAAVTPDQITQQNSLQRAEGSKTSKGGKLLCISVNTKKKCLYNIKLLRQKTNNGIDIKLTLKKNKYKADGKQMPIVIVKRTA
jgi:hypothetical protein